PFFLALRFEDEAYTVGRLRHASEEQAAFGHEERAPHLARAHRPERVREVAHRGRDVPLSRGVPGHPVMRDEVTDAVAGNLATHRAERGDQSRVALRDVAAA